jgi:hypothetical protein
MAGFAVFMTIVTYGLLLLVLATIASIALVMRARKRLPEGLEGRRAFLHICAFAPFAGLLWLIVALLIHVQISNKLAHQDPGLSGDPYVTLPNGFVLGSHNTYDGYIVAPKYETGVPVTGPGYVRSIIDLDWKDGIFSGTQFDFNSSKVRRFTFNTQDLSIKTFDLGPLTWHAGDPSPLDHPYSYWNLYAQYRHHWPNYILVAVIILGESGIAFVLWGGWTAFRQRAIEVNRRPAP